MGLRRMGPPAGLVDALRRRFDIRNFVETGTYRGDTAAWAAGHFPRVVTIEAAPALAARARARFTEPAGPRVVEGNSAIALAAVVAGLDGAALFWLDAHWSGGETSAEHGECPLVGEVDAINRSKHEHFLLVDDARFFGAPPPLPHDSAHWPSLLETVNLLTAGGRRHVVLVDDVFVAVPESARTFLVEFCQREASESWRRERGWRGRLRRWLD